MNQPLCKFNNINFWKGKTKFLENFDQEVKDVFPLLIVSRSCPPVYNIYENEKEIGKKEINES